MFYDRTQLMTFTFRPKLSFTLLICIVLAASPFLSFPLWTDTSYHNKQRIVEAVYLTLLLIVGPMRLFSKERTWLTPSRAVLLCLSAFFLLGFFSCLNAYSTRHAFYEWASFLLLLTLAWVIALEIHSARDSMLDAVLTICGVGCALYLVPAIVVYVAALLSGAKPGPYDLISGFDNIRFFNHVQTVSLPILGLLALRSQASRKWYWFWFGITAMWWMMLFVSAGRGTFIGLSAGIAITWFCRRNHAMPWCRLMFYTCLFGFVAYYLFCVLVPGWVSSQPIGLSTEVVQRTLDNPLSNREHLWKLAAQLIVERPWLGMAPLHFAHYGQAIQTGAHPHNWILQVASEWGVPALLFLMTAIGIASHSLLHIGRFIQGDEDRNQATLSAWLTIGAAVLVDGLVSGLIVMPISQLWIALYLGCAWGWVSSFSPIDESRKAAVKGGMARSTGAFAVLLSLLVLFWSGLFPEILDLSAFEAAAWDARLYFNGSFWPRIWRAGYF